MSLPHPSPADLEHYVLGALEPQAAARLEAHTLECPDCARRLHQEALLEEHLREVARAPRVAARGVRPARWNALRRAAPALGLMAAAALALLLVPVRTERPSTTPLVEEDDFPMMAPLGSAPSTAERLVACPDPTSQDSCASEALARGLWVQYPRGLGAIPRYEGHAGLPLDRLAAGPSAL
jgi:hypothetical protein